jgi:hypothetical protein
VHIVTKAASLAAIAGLLAACSGGVNSVPTTSQPSSTNAAPAITSHTIIENGATLHIMFTKDMNGTAAPGTTGLRVPLAGTSSGGNLLYNGGPVQTAPKIYVVFWGSSWGTLTSAGPGDPDGMQSYYLSFLNAAAGSKWLNSVTQYTQSGGQHVGNSGITIISYVDTANTPPSRPSQSAIAAEATRAAAKYGDYSASASYVVVSPHGIRPSGFISQYCAWHSSTSTANGKIAYTNLPYIPDATWHCGLGSVTSPGTLDGVSIVGGHEQAETETDPQPNTGWLDSSGAENGDKCAWTNLIDNPNAGNFPTQPLWSNASSSCVQSY